MEYIETGIKMKILQQDRISTLTKCKIDIATLADEAIRESNAQSNMISGKMQIGLYSQEERRRG